MGNLNKFYLMGRVARAPQATGEGSEKTVTLAITPGTSTRNPRGGAAEPLLLEAGGPQADGAEALRVGQGVFVRGQLRQESRGDASALVARIQAIELLAPPPRKPRPPREGGDGESSEGEGPGASKRRGRRRGRGRGRGREGAPERKPAEAGAKPVEAAKPDLPPPEPVVQPPPEPVQPPPDPTLEQDMPF